MTKKLMKFAVLTAGLLAAVPMARADFQPYDYMKNLDPEGKAVIGCGALLAGTALGLTALHTLGWKKKKQGDNWFNHYWNNVRGNTIAMASSAVAYSGISRFVAMYNGQPTVAAQPAPVVQPSIVNVTVENAQFTMPQAVYTPVVAPVETGKEAAVIFKGFPRIQKTEFYKNMKQKAIEYVQPAVIVPEVQVEAPVMAQTAITEVQTPVAPGMFATAQNWVSSQWNSLSPNTQTGVMVGAAAATLAGGVYAYKKYTHNKQLRELATAQAQRLAAQRAGIENAVAQAQRLQRRAERRRAFGLPEQPQAPQLQIVVAENNRPDIVLDGPAGGPAVV